MIGLAGSVRRTVEDVREWIIRELKLKQKPELDRKIDEMLKPPKVNQIMVKYLGVGKEIGKRLGRCGGGRSIGAGIRLLRRLL